MTSGTARLGGDIEPFWRRFNTEAWEPEWRALVDVLDREHVSVSVRAAVERLTAALASEDAQERLAIMGEWMDYLDDMATHEDAPVARAMLEDALRCGEGCDVIDALVGVACGAPAPSVEAPMRALELLRGVMLHAPALRSKLVGEHMETLLGRLLDDDVSAAAKGYVIELLLSVVADDQEYQRDFMRRNGISTLCGVYSKSQHVDAELCERASMFIGVFVGVVLPSGASAALSDALIADAMVSIEDAIGAEGRDAAIELGKIATLGGADTAAIGLS
jgi:hypothetical protein